MDRQQRAEVAKRLYTEDDQITIKQVAAKLGVSHTTVWEDLKRLGVPRRPTPADYRDQRIARQMVARAEKRRKKEERQANLEIWDIERFIDSI